jgi:hypothetical protein
MTNANHYRTKNDLANLSQSLQPNRLQANTLATHLSPFGHGKQAAVSSSHNFTFRPSI